MNAEHRLPPTELACQLAPFGSRPTGNGQELMELRRPAR
jgi:hypothetical protein